MIKNYFRILKKPHAYLQTILKTPVKFQKDRTETVGGVKGTKYLLKTRNHAPRPTRHAPRPTENQKQCPFTFLRKGGGQKTRIRGYSDGACCYRNTILTSGITEEKIILFLIPCPEHDVLICGFL